MEDLHRSKLERLSWAERSNNQTTPLDIRNAISKIRTEGIKMLNVTERELLGFSIISLEDLKEACPDHVLYDDKINHDPFSLKDLPEEDLRRILSQTLTPVCPGQNSFPDKEKPFIRYLAIDEESSFRRLESWKSFIDELPNLQYVSLRMKESNLRHINGYLSLMKEHNITVKELRIFNSDLSRHENGWDVNNNSFNLDDLKIEIDDLETLHIVCRTHFPSIKQIQRLLKGQSLKEIKLEYNGGVFSEEELESLKELFPNVSITQNQWNPPLS